MVLENAELQVSGLRDTRNKRIRKPLLCPRAFGLSAWSRPAPTAHSASHDVPAAAVRRPADRSAGAPSRRRPPQCQRVPARTGHRSMPDGADNSPSTSGALCNTRVARPGAGGVDRALAWRDHRSLAPVRFERCCAPPHHWTAPARATLSSGRGPLPSIGSSGRGSGRRGRPRLGVTHTW